MLVGRSFPEAVKEGKALRTLHREEKRRKAQLMVATVAPLTLVYHSVAPFACRLAVSGADFD